MAKPGRKKKDCTADKAISEHLDPFEDVPVGEFTLESTFSSDSGTDSEDGCEILLEGDAYEDDDDRDELADKLELANLKDELEDMLGKDVTVGDVFFAFEDEYDRDELADKLELANLKDELEKLLGKDVAVGDVSLEPVFNGYESDLEYSSDSAEFLPELDGTYQDDDASEHESESDGVKALRMEVAQKTMEVDRLKEDPEFVKYLEAHADELEQDSDSVGFETSDYDMEAEISDQDMEADSSIGKPFTSSTIDSWCQLVKENDLSVLPNLLNAYRVACLHGSDRDISAISERIRSGNTFYKILDFILCNVDDIFRTYLGISTSACNEDAVLSLKESQKWKVAEPWIQSYLSSTIIFVNHVSDSVLLALALTRLRVSIIFFAAFPSLLQKLIKVTVYLWLTGEAAVLSASFGIMCDASTQLLSSNCLESCLIKSYKAFIVQSKHLGPTKLLHTEFLANSLVKLYSLNVPESCWKALVSIQQLGKLLHQCLHTKKKETMEKICSWSYINCVDLWAKYVCANTGDYELQQWVSLIVRIINGVALLFPGPRYLPLRVKCIQMLNQLSSSSTKFIPVTSLVLNCIGYVENGNSDAKSAKNFNMSFALQVPKQWLKSRPFQEECVSSAIELLSAHFAQWSYHISFPELAAIPLTRLRMFYQKTAVESLRARVKLLIDMVEQNVEFVNKKREKVTFSIFDKASVESFRQEIQVESEETSFTRYYLDIIESGHNRSVALKREAAAKIKIGNVHEKVLCAPEFSPFVKIPPAGIFGMAIGLVLENAVVIAGDPEHIIIDKNLILGVTGNTDLVHQLLEVLRKELDSQVCKLEEFATVILQHIRLIVKSRGTHLFVLMGGCDTKSPKLWNINKGGSSRESVKCIGHGKEYADLVVKDIKLFNPKMGVKEAYELARQGFAKAQLAHCPTGAKIIRCGHVLLSTSEAL